jgi:hypothetical protein
MIILRNAWWVINAPLRVDQVDQVVLKARQARFGGILLLDHGHEAAVYSIATKINPSLFDMM